MAIDYTCTLCKDDVPLLFEGGICSTCYQKAGNILTFPQWEAIMKLAHPGKAWND